MAKKSSRRGAGRSQRDSLRLENLDRTIVAIPLLVEIKKPGGLKKIHDIIIDLNLDFAGGRDKGRDEVRRWIEALPGVTLDR